MNISFEQLCVLLVVGTAAGWLASLILKRGGLGLVGCILVGVAGSFLGRFVLGVLGFSAGNTLATFITALLGSLLLLWVLSRLPFGKGKKTKK